MPTAACGRSTTALSATLARFLEGENKNESDCLLEEVRALRQEIAELRQALVPVPSVILIGRQALEEFKKLTQK